ncbi:MAG: hypothetical protein HY080_04405 [Gammaproteobacteria bacterium]|nr:hypothetical protein [Gammaproteobacteria bacterium]
MSVLHFFSPILVRRLIFIGLVASNGLMSQAAPSPSGKPAGVQLAPLTTPATATTSPPGTAAPAAGSVAELAHKIWIFANGEKTLNQIKAGLGGTENQLSVSIDKPMAEKINNVLTEAFDPVPGLFQDYVVQNGKPEQLAAITKWMESPFGKKVREAEARAPALQYNELERTVPLKEPKFSTEREALYKRYEKIAYAANARIITATMEFYTVINNGIKPPTERMPPKELEQTLKLAHTRMATITQQLLPHLFASTYRDMIVDELKIYINFLETDAGHAYLQLTSNAYVAALEKIRPGVLLKLASIFEDELAVLSPYSKEPLSEQKQRQLLITMIKRFGKPPLIGAILDIRGGQITIVRGGVQQETFGRPNHEYINVDTIIKDLHLSKIDLRRYYQVVQKHVRSGQ